MPMSPSASSSPTPSSTSRVIMTGLIGPDLRREDCWSGPSHDDWRKTCLIESCRWNPAEKLGISHGRSGKDGYHIYRVPPTILWPFPLRMQFPVEEQDQNDPGSPKVLAISAHTIFKVEQTAGAALNDPLFRQIVDNFRR